MSLYHARAKQPEILRTVEKDSTYSDQVGQSLSAILRLTTSTTTWIKYNHLCQLFAELSYHGFTSYQNLQTLGEEYTGTIQVDSKYISLPGKFTQFIGILLEFCGEDLFLKLIGSVRRDFENPAEPESIQKTVILCDLVAASIPYLKVAHRSLFYWQGGKYHISKRITGINYVLVRHWLSVDHPTYGYKLLSILTGLQIIIVLIDNIRTQYTKRMKEKSKLALFKAVNTTAPEPENTFIADNREKCVLCLERRRRTSVTVCGHIFCWSCIHGWLDQKEECPICREKLKKSNVILLQNLK